MEIFNKIPKYSLYEASNLGNIKTFNWKNKGKTAIMKPAKDANGYLRTMLVGDDGKTSTIKVHRIIAQTFLPNPYDLPHVNHKNGIKTDNCVENLEWISISGNIKHSFEMGSHNVTGEKNPASILTEKQVLEIRANYTFGKKTKVKGHLTKKQIAENYGVTFACIKNIIMGNTWKHLL